MAKKIFLFCGLAGSLLVASLPAQAAERAVFRLGGVVQTVCRLEMGGMGSEQSADVISFGSFTQLCNSKSGYRLIMRHPSNMGGAELTIDGRTVQLSNGNETVIVDENRATFKVSDAQLNLRDTNMQVSSLSFRIEPKGLIY